MSQSLLTKEIYNIITMNLPFPCYSKPIITENFTKQRKGNISDIHGIFYHFQVYMLLYGILLNTTRMCYIASIYIIRLNTNNIDVICKKTLTLHLRIIRNIKWLMVFGKSRTCDDMRWASEAGHTPPHAWHATSADARPGQLHCLSSPSHIAGRHFASLPYK